MRAALLQRPERGVEAEEIIPTTPKAVIPANAGIHAWRCCVDLLGRLRGHVCAQLFVYRRLRFCVTLCVTLAATLCMPFFAAPALAAGETCIACHADAAQRSYALSKHGVITRLEAGRPRLRAPRCADCHGFEAGAPAPGHYADAGQREAARQQAVAGCSSCHSPRYVREQLAASARGLAIGEMKRREAEALVAAARQELSGAALAAIEAAFATLRGEHLRDLRLGLAHQSPDYQWWLGQAALDGDLLRIKGALGEARRAEVPTRAVADRKPQAGR